MLSHRLDHLKEALRVGVKASKDSIDLLTRHVELTEVSSVQLVSPEGREMVWVSKDAGYPVFDGVFKTSVDPELDFVGHDVPRANVLKVFLSNVDKRVLVLQFLRSIDTIRLIASG